VAVPETPVPAPSTALSTLTAREQALLDFETERRFPRGDGARDRDVHATFGLSMTRYLQLLHHLLDRPDALAYAPATVRRLQRIRMRGNRPWRLST
jgi:hypothetical protein